MFTVLSGEATVLDAINSGSLYGHVHSVFTHTVNFVDKSTNRLCCLVHASQDNGPGSVTVNIQDFANLAFLPGQPVHAAQGTLWVANQEFTCTTARPWQAKKLQFPACTNTLAAMLRHVQDTVQPCQHQGSHSPAPFDAEVERRVRAGTTSLVQALHQGNLPLAEQAIAGLVGLGAGLTPTGDDVLLGLLAVSGMHGAPIPHHAAFARMVLACAQRNTNAISQAGLAEAAAGCLRETIADAVKALCTGPEQAVDAAFTRLRSIGSSSGGDIAYGIVQGGIAALVTTTS